VSEPSPDTPPPLSPRERRSALETRVLGLTKWLLYTIFAVLGWLVVSYLASILGIVLIALGIAYLLTPVCDWMVARGVRRGLAAALLLLGFLGILVGGITFAAPRIANEITSFANAVPGMIDNLAHWTADHLNLTLPADWKEYFQSPEFKKVVQEAAGPVQQIATVAVGSAFHLLATLVELLLVPVFAFYFLLDWHDIVERLKKIVPPRNRAHVFEIFRQVDDVVAGWVRGQATVTALLAVLYAIGFSIVGIHLAIPVGILVGVLTIIPFLGTFIGAAIVIGLTLLDWQGAGPLIGVGVVILLLHLLEAAVLTPKITGHKVGLSESAALFAVVAGGKLLGFVGVLLAVPLAATVAVLLRHAVRAYEHSEFFGQESDAEVPMPRAMKTILPDRKPTAPAADLADPDPDDDPTPVARDDAGDGTPSDQDPT